MAGPFTEYLCPTTVIDSTHPDVVAYTQNRVQDADSDLQKAVNLYYAVRDEFRYDPYYFRLDEDGFKASETLKVGRGWCVPKAILLAACCRAQGIPARLGFADVRNHLSTERMRQTMKTDVFHWHAYTSIYLEGKWVKATPAFNIELCTKFGLKPLEFDGLQDSLYHEFDQAGNKHMEYLHERGEFADFPFEQMMATFAEVYGETGLVAMQGHSFDDDVNREA